MATHLWDHDAPRDRIRVLCLLLLQQRRCVLHALALAHALDGEPRCGRASAEWRACVHRRPRRPRVGQHQDERERDAGEHRRYVLWEAYCTANQERKAESIRDEWIKVMQLRLVRDELQKCHRAEGENHYYVCAPIVKVYNDLLKEARVCSTERRGILTAGQGLPHCGRIDECIVAAWIDQRAAYTACRRAPQGSAGRVYGV